MKRCLMDDFSTILAVPSQAVPAALWPRLLENKAHRVRKANGIVWCVGWQQEHLSFSDRYVTKDVVFLDNLQQHRSAVLIEPFCCLVDMVVRPGIGSSHNLMLVSVW